MISSFLPDTRYTPSLSSPSLSIMAAHDLTRVDIPSGSTIEDRLDSKYLLH